MQALVFYLLLPFIYLISWLPFRLMYLFSDFLFIIIYYIVGYRKKVVDKNLRIAFPEKSDKEILQIRKKYYSFLCDLMLETLKMLTISKKQMMKHIYFSDMKSLDDLYQKKQSFVFLLGHNGNWEWASAAVELHSAFHLLVIYKPLSSKYFDPLFHKMRTRFGQEVTPMKNTLRDMIRLKDQLTATAFVSDQRPDARIAYWTTFFGEETGFFQGTEKLTKKFKYPIVYISIKRPKRGYYEIVPEILVENPHEKEDSEITEAFVRRLEKQIRDEPELWLWSHDRWRDKKPESIK